MQSWDTTSLDVEPHHPQVLRSDPNSRAILINLPEGELLQEHETHEEAYLVITGGVVEVEQGGETVNAGPGFAAHFKPHERREVRARDDARLLLILAPWPAEGRPSAS